MTKTYTLTATEAAICELQHEWEQSIDPKVRAMTWIEFLRAHRPYPGCRGNPTIEDCIRRGYCGREIACND